jgi:hypothetical protein
MAIKFNFPNHRPSFSKTGDRCHVFSCLIALTILRINKTMPPNTVGSALSSYEQARNFFQVRQWVFAFCFGDRGFGFVGGRIAGGDGVAIGLAP